MWKTYVNFNEREGVYGLKFLKSKFFIITASLALALCIFFSVLSFMGVGNVVRNGINTVLYPLRWCGAKISEGFDGFYLYFGKMSDLIEENKNLREENDKLIQNEIYYGALADENQRLREYLEIKKAYPDFSLCDALIISRGSEGYMTIITLNRGSADGIEVGMPVITSMGLVGSVIEVDYSSCKVRTIIEDRGACGAYITRSGEIGVVEGDIIYKDSGLCSLNFLPENADIVVGDTVFTSGLGSIYPRDIPVGKVVGVTENAFDRTKSAEIETFVDFKRITYVSIITDFDYVLETDGVAP